MTIRWYAAYLASEHWRSRRLRALALASLRDGVPRCEFSCGRTDGLEVHHFTYRRLGAELDEDLAVLCRECHLLVTDHPAVTGAMREHVEARRAWVAARCTPINAVDWPTVYTDTIGKP